MKPHFDYIRLATWDTTDYLFRTAALMRLGGFSRARWLQYIGRKSRDGRTFFGMAEQSHKRHHVIQFSGGLAEERYPQWQAYPDSFYCTRLDIQVTIEEPSGHDAESLYKRLNRKGKSIVKSPGCSTVYLGVRTSELFTRIYEKPIEGKRFLRCEFELKGGYAKTAYENLRSGTTSPKHLFMHCLNQARVPKPHYGWFKLNGDVSGGLDAAEKYRSLAATKTWLDNTETGIMRHLGHEETRGMVLSFIERLETAREWAYAIDSKKLT